MGKSFVFLGCVTLLFIAIWPTNGVAQIVNNTANSEMESSTIGDLSLEGGATGKGEKDHQNNEFPSELSEMNFKQLNDLVYQYFLEDSPDKNSKHVDALPAFGWEHCRRIMAEPDSNVVLIALRDKTLVTEYRSYLLDVYSMSTGAMGRKALLDFKDIVKVIIADIHEEDSVRISALRAINFLLKVERDNAENVARIKNEFSGMLMDIFGNPFESSDVRVGSLSAMHSLGLHSLAPKILKLYVSGKAGSPQLKRKIIMILGQWQYKELFPVVTALLKSNEDRDLREMAIRALGDIGEFEVILPLIECIDRNQDIKVACKRAIHKNALLLYETIGSKDRGNLKLALRASWYIRGTPDELVTLLTPLLDDSDSEIVLLAAKRLARSRDLKINSMLMERLKGSPGSELETLLNGLDPEQIRRLPTHPTQELHRGGGHGNEKGAKPHLELGAAVYRNKANGPFLHAGIYLGNDDGSTRDEIIHGDGTAVNIGLFSTIYSHSQEDFKGVYESSGLDFTTRQSIISTAKALVGIDYFWGIALNYQATISPDTKISIENIETLRCDGVVEYSYEVNGVNVWAEDLLHSNHYDISKNSAWADEHNQIPFPVPPLNCLAEFSPNAQIGDCDSNTKFNEAAAGVGPKLLYEMNIYHELVVTATDEQSGIFSLDYTISGCNPVLSEIQFTYPESNFQTIIIPWPESNTITIEVWDNAGNGSILIDEYIEADEITACPIGGFVVNAGYATWDVLDDDGSPHQYQVFSSNNEYSRRWVEIGKIDYTGVGSYRIPVKVNDKDALFRLKEVNANGFSEIAATYLPSRAIVSPSLPGFPNQSEARAILDIQFDELGGKGDVLVGEKNGDLETQCVIYCPPQFIDDVQSYLVSFWENHMGIGIELIDTSAFVSNPISSDYFREALKGSIAAKSGEGLELFHIIGDASEWEVVTEMDPGEFPFSGVIQPERDLIPTYYLYDSSILSWDRPYYSSDFPYSDIDDDGLPDVVLTRWPVATIDELLPRISKVIEYNKNRGAVSNYAGVDFLGMIGDLDIGSNTGELAEEIALYAMGNIPEEANVNLTIKRESELGDGYVVPQVANIWNSLDAECIFLWSPHSSRRRPNTFLDNGASGLGEGYPALVFAAGCLTADFSRTDGNGGPSAPLAADTYCQFFDRGSVAWVGPTNPSFQSVNRDVPAAFIENLFSNPDWTMAKAWLEAVRDALGNSNFNASYKKNIRTFAFLGDPLSRLEKKPIESTFSAENSLFTAGITRKTNSADFVDYDSDGDLDLYLSYGEDSSNSEDCDSANLVARYNGVSGFDDGTPQSAGTGIDWVGPTVSTAWADIDNDGDQDLYMINGDVTDSDNPNLLFRNDSNNGVPDFVRVQTGDVLSYEDESLGGRSEWIDLDNDGDLDLYVGRVGQSNLVFTNSIVSGDAVLTQAVCPSLTAVNYGEGFSWGDYNSDGRPDLFIFGDDGDNSLLRNNGNLSFSDVTSSQGFGEDLSGQGTASSWCDFDNDGDFDLLVCLNVAGLFPVKLFRNDGASFTCVSEDYDLLALGGVSAVAWSDIDNDGDMDIIFAANPGQVCENLFPVPKFERNEAYSLNGFTTPLTINCADYDNDGDEDIYCGRNWFEGSMPSSSALYINTIADNSNWLKINLEGQNCNRDAIGSIVSVFTGNGLIQTRQMLGSVGGTAHQSRSLTIGLGESIEATKIRVEWPWGRVTEVPVIASGQTITISDAEAASEIGDLYLTTDPAGSRQPLSGPVPLFQNVNLYLFADISDGLGNGYQLGGFETRVDFPLSMNLSSVELLTDGTNNGDGLLTVVGGTIYDFTVEFTTGTSGSNGIVPLASFSCNIIEEGPDPFVSLQYGQSYSAYDPIEGNAPCWWDSESNVLFRFEDSVETGGMLIPLDDTKAPECVHSGLFTNSRNVIVLSFDEPINTICSDGSSSTDASHFTVYNITNPTVVKNIVSIIAYPNDKDFLVILDSDIPVNKEFDIRIEDFQDHHLNLAGTLVEPVTRNGGGGGDPGINELLTGGGGAKDGSGVEVFWVELFNEGDVSVCLNGWSLSTSESNQVIIPDTPIVILAPGRYAVLSGEGHMPEDLPSDAAKYSFDVNLGIESGSVSVLDPFGVVVDVVEANTFLKFKTESGASAQKFTDANGNGVTWEFDGPEYQPGMLGTPGQKNSRIDGSESNPDVPIMSGLLYAAPNPFNPTTSIFFSILDRGEYSVEVFDLRGRKVTTLFSGTVEPTAKMEVVWSGDTQSGSRIASGTYFVRLRSDSKVYNTLKITMLK